MGRYPLNINRINRKQIVNKSIIPLLQGYCIILLYKGKRTRKIRERIALWYPGFKSLIQ